MRVTFPSECGMVQYDFCAVSRIGTYLGLSVLMGLPIAYMVVGVESSRAASSDSVYRLLWSRGELCVWAHGLSPPYNIRNTLS